MNLLNDFIGSKIGQVTDGIKNAKENPGLLGMLVGLGEHIKRVQKKHIDIVYKKNKKKKLTGGNILDDISEAGESMLGLVGLGEDLDDLHQHHTQVMQHLQAGNEMIRGGNYMVDQAGNEMIRGGNYLIDRGGNEMIRGGNYMVDDEDATGAGFNPFTFLEDPTKFLVKQVME